MGLAAAVLHVMLAKGTFLEGSMTRVWAMQLCQCVRVGDLWIQPPPRMACIAIAQEEEQTSDTCC